MAHRKTTSVDEHYHHGRSHPHGRTHENPHRIHREPSMEAADHQLHPGHRRAYNPHEAGHDLAREIFDASHEAHQAPQAPEDQRAPNYHNDTPDDWLRGGGENACTKPGFDYSPPRDKMRR